MPRLNRDTTAYGTRKPKKLCLNENGQFDLDELRNRDKGKKALRIDNRTIILVKKKDYTEEHAEKFRSRTTSKY